MVLRLYYALFQNRHCGFEIARSAGWRRSRQRSRSYCPRKPLACIAAVGGIANNCVVCNSGQYIKKSPLAMECKVVDVYNTPGFESFICTISGTYADEEYLNEAGKIDYRKLKPVLFEFPTYEYLKTGDVIGKCLSLKNKETI